ncbi:50S ribosomal protein L4 [Kamptonema cortianum]|nr:50S ribosomal protein L4 [Geitlerinema splendidum]MDK3160411.1 50S ribosomal protein L4 [Kamptonema cortianum]
MAEFEILDSKGKSVGKHKLNDAIASVEVGHAVIHRAVVAEQANSRQGTHSARTRSEARGGGRKPYKQKKTGNARQGTIRAPHYAHGGMAFAIKPRDYSKKVNKKERRLAIIAAFSAKVNAGDVVLTKDIQFKAPKTKEAQAILKALGVAEAKRVLLVLPEHNDVVLKSFRNIPNVEVRTAPTREGTGEPFSTRDLLLAHKIVVTEGAMKKTEEAWLK